MNVPAFFLALCLMLAGVSFTCSVGAKGRIRSVYYILVQAFLLVALLIVFGMVFLWRPS